MSNNEINKIEQEIKNEEDIKKLIEENLRLTREVYKISKYVKSFVVFSQIASVLKIMLFVIPIILGIIYLPPLLGQVFSQYQELLGLTEKADKVNLDSLPPEILNFIKK